MFAFIKQVPDSLWGSSVHGGPSVEVTRKYIKKYLGVEPIINNRQPRLPVCPPARLPARGPLNDAIFHACTPYSVLIAIALYVYIIQVSKVSTYVSYAYLSRLHMKFI